MDFESLKRCPNCRVNSCPGCGVYASGPRGPDDDTDPDQPRRRDDAGGPDYDGDPDRPNYRDDWELPPGFDPNTN